jgi:hypothetical protein
MQVRTCDWLDTLFTDPAAKDKRRLPIAVEPAFVSMHVIYKFVLMCLCIGLYVYVCMCVYVYACVCMYICACVYTYTHTYMHTYIHIYIYTYVYTYVYTYACLAITSMSLHPYVHIHVQAYLWMTLSWQAAEFIAHQGTQTYIQTCMYNGLCRQWRL